MRSTYLLAGAGLAAVLSFVAVLAVALEWWWLAAACAMALLSGTFLAALDADRRARALRKSVLKLKPSTKSSKPAPVTAQPPPMTEADVVGAVRVLQAQYVGRMDRLQDSLDEAVAQLRAEGRAAGQPTRDAD